MKAIIRSQYGPPDVLELKDVDKPVAEDDDVLVRVRASGVNMADVDYLRGQPRAARIGTGLRQPKNSRLGLDVAGHVEAVGKNVTRFKPSDEVFGDLTKFGFGSFAEYVCAPADAFALKPARLTFEEAATVPQAAVMALQGLRGRRGVQSGQRVLINGAGGNIGPFAVQIAKHFGAEVTGVDSAGKLDMIRSIGADHVIDYTEEDYTESGHRYDWILDIAAHRSVFDSRRALAPGGVYVMVPGSMTGAFQAMVVGPLISMTRTQRMGMLKWSPFKMEDVSLLTKLIDAGDVSPVIARRYPLEQTAEALRYQEGGTARGKIVIIV
jgi:NADPH:quinone reductase-like Zn-dependent oxidoreductase